MDKIDRIKINATEIYNGRMKLNLEIDELTAWINAGGTKANFRRFINVDDTYDGDPISINNKINDIKNTKNTITNVISFVKSSIPTILIVWLSLIITIGIINIKFKRSLVSNFNKEKETLLSEIELLERSLIEMNKCKSISVFFKVNSSELISAEKRKLDGIFDVIKNNNCKIINVIGHAQKTGNDVNELLLSKERAFFIADILDIELMKSKNELPEGFNIQISYCGSYLQLFDIPINDTEKMFNRRVEIRMVF